MPDELLKNLKLPLYKELQSFAAGFIFIFLLGILKYASLKNFIPADIISYLKSNSLIMIAIFSFTAGRVLNETGRVVKAVYSFLNHGDWKAKLARLKDIFIFDTRKPAKVGGKDRRITITEIRAYLEKHPEIHSWYEMAEASSHFMTLGIGFCFLSSILISLKIFVPLGILFFILGLFKRGEVRKIYLDIGETVHKHKSSSNP